LFLYVKGIALRTVPEYVYAIATAIAGVDVCQTTVVPSVARPGFRARGVEASLFDLAQRLLHRSRGLLRSLGLLGNQPDLFLRRL
jgi:hypothetical protein